MSNNVTELAIHTKSTVPEFFGFFFLVASSTLYGSNYLPVKQFETGDGMFFQFNMSLGIWLVGLVVNIMQKFPKFYLLPMLSGFFWAVCFYLNKIFVILIH